MANIMWTPAQAAAIGTDGGDLLVSAAAGSGKTAVLTERVVRLMTGPQPVDADRLLIATFTNAAAGEMRRRIRDKLAALLRDRPADANLHRQMRLLENAQIGTVHAFCQRLIREHFEQLDIAPNFRLLGEEEARLLKTEVAERTVRQAYENDDPVFFELVELLGTSRSDARVTDTVLRIYEFVSAHPFPRVWMNDKLALYRDDRGAAESIWGQAILAYARSAVDYCLSENARLVDLCEGDEALREKYLPAMLGDRSMLSGLRDALDLDWDTAVHAFGGVSYGRLGSLKEHPDKERVRDLRDGIKKTLAKVCDCFRVREADFREDIADLQPKIACLFDLVLHFDDTYAAQKRERGAMDFTDLEQMAVELLIERGADGALRPTELAEDIKGRFDAVMVDEYQDINAVQEAIFAAVSTGANRFMVGDVKQSIYRFRQASPQLFIEKMDRFLPVEQGFPAIIRLGHNFRSRREVTDVINAVFALLLSREVGDLDYTEGEYLIPNEDDPMPGAGAELILIDADASEEVRALDVEADYVAAHVHNLINSGFEVRAGDAFRPVEPEDIALILSAPKTSALPFIRALGRRGIAASSQRRPEFLAAYEVAPVVGLLAALDNPLREVELSAALLSPIFGLVPDDLATLRTAYRDRALITALRLAAGEGGEPFAGAYALFENLRRLALTMPPHELIARIYEETGYEVAVGFMQNSAQRLANIRLLIGYAAGEAAKGRGTLPGLVRYFDSLAQRGQDLPAAAVGESRGVSVLSIHQSKGLEYPVVYLCHLGKQINKQDLRERAILHPEFGFASVRRDPERRIYYDSLPYTAVKLESERALMGEELRKLYVAMTRAKDKLVMTCAVKNPQERLDQGGVSLSEAGRLPSHQVRSAASMADWLLSCLPHMNVATLAVEVAGAAPAASVATPAARPPASSGVDPEKIALWNRRVDFDYPDARAVQIPAKLSVSELTKTDVAARFLRRPSFLSPEGLSPTERGNAVHRFMQLCDYRRAAEDAPAELGRLMDRGLMAAEQGRAVDLNRVRHFFESDIGRRVLSADRVLREFEFVAPAGADVVGRYLPALHIEGESIMIQGIADCIFIEGDRAVLLDYKTDYISDGPAFVLRYGPQVSVYRALLPDFLGRPIEECYLYAFHLNRAFEVPPEPL